MNGPMDPRDIETGQVPAGQGALVLEFRRLASAEAPAPENVDVEAALIDSMSKLADQMLATKKDFRAIADSAEASSKTVLSFGKTTTCLAGQMLAVQRDIRTVAETTTEVTRAMGREIVGLGEMMAKVTETMSGAVVRQARRTARLEMMVGILAGVLTGSLVGTWIALALLLAKLKGASP